MSSLISGFAYDIFISYRHNDNRSGWITEFVAALQEELAATLKEPISVYFDTNPHDGLLETHNVDKSLEGKLKCLIFIPIISQTYCDSKSFAWQHEFIAFNKMANEDQFGRDIKLSSGNVASRILPVKIHELDVEDKALLENGLGGVLRSIDFIYKSAGVNRPLRANEDHPQDNLNKTYYRDQINKVANAVKEIITALKKYNQQDRGISREGSKAKPESPKKLTPKIIIGSIFVLALLVLGYFIIPKLSNSSKPLEKSIAVLPFINDSPDKDNAYFINGIMDEILNNLQKIKDFRVLSRTSTEQYRGTNKQSIPKIAKDLGVNYIVEGSGQKYGNKFVLRVQLISADNEKHLWAKSYDQAINETSDLINIQSQIAQSIAAELKATMTPEEKQLIEKTPTANLTAYDFYQRGREEHIIYWINNSNKAALQKAEDLFRKALKCDSTFAQAYTGLARVYWDKHYFQEYFSENFMDSILILTNIALSFDNQYSEAYTLRGIYYNEIGKQEQAVEEFDKAIKFNPNSWEAYFEKGRIYWGNDLVNLIDNYQKAATINRGPELPALLGEIGFAYLSAGFPEKSKYSYQEELKLDGDSSVYYCSLARDEYFLENIDRSIDFGVKGYAIDSTNYDILEYLGEAYSLVGKYDESLNYFKKWFGKLKTQGALSTINMHRIGYAYWQNGYKEEAEYFFNEQTKYDNRMNDLNRPGGIGLNTYYDLAGVYAFRGEKEKAYKNLRIYNQSQRIPLFMVMTMKTDPLFNSIRNEPEFQQIVKDVEAKYQAEHERVRKWLEEQGTL
jgi:TolB-like protein